MSDPTVKCDRFGCSMRETYCVGRYVASHAGKDGDIWGCAGCPQGAARNGQALTLVPVRFSRRPISAQL